MSNEWTIGELFAGIGGFSLGFERAGWRTIWQVEINALNRAVLAERFPQARQFLDVRGIQPARLDRPRCICFGFPCQDISVMGGNSPRERAGLDGARSGLFFEAMRIVGAIQPEWVVIENVPQLLKIRDGRDFAEVVCSLRERGYLGCWRVLDGYYFGSPCRRRRLFVVAGLGRNPHADLLADAGAVVRLSSKITQEQERSGAERPGYCLTTSGSAGNRINLGSENLVAEKNRWYAMSERARAVEDNGFSRGLDAANAAEAFSAGNAVHPAIAEWIARILMRS